MKQWNKYISFNKAVHAGIHAPVNGCTVVMDTSNKLDNLDVRPVQQASNPQQEKRKQSVWVHARVKPLSSKVQRQSCI